MRVFLNAISFYLPQGKLTNDDINREFPEWSVDKISNKTGIYSRHIASENEFASDMAVCAVENLFREYNFQKDKIDFVLYCTQSPDYFLPTTACILQDRLGLSTEIGALDYNLGCSGYVYGLSLAKGLIVAGVAENVLLITSETYSKFIHSSDRNNRTIFGDAATASIISRKRWGFNAEIKNFVLGTDGAGAENLIVRNGGLRNKQNYTTYENVTNEKFTVDNHLFMNGGEIFNFTSKAIPDLVNDVLKKNKHELKDIDLFVFHQANKFMLNHIRQKINIDTQKFFIFLENCGNTVSSTIPIALVEAFNNQKIIKKKNKVLLAGFGVGYSWGGTVLDFK